MIEIDPRDAALQASCPTIGTPMFGALSEAPLGQRMVLARNGVYLQMKTPWLDCLTKVGSVARGLKLPYGALQEQLSFAFGGIPKRLLSDFIEEARKALPNETAGALIFDVETGQLCLRMHEAIEVGSARIHYRIAELGDSETLAVDLHSHGHLSAFWSGDDDADDTGVRVCGVFGNLDRAEPSAKFRLVLNGHFKALPSPWDEVESMT